MAEALEKVKADLGGDAVILHTRTLRRGGVLGVGARNVVEITASRDPRALPAAERRAMMGRESATPPRAPLADRHPRTPGASSASRAPAVYPPPAPTRKPEAPAAASTLQDEINEIRAMVRQLLDRPVGNAEGESASAAGPLPEVPEEFRGYYTRLLQHAVAEQLARDCIAKAKARLAECRSRILAGLGGKLDTGQVQEAVSKKLQELIPAVLAETLERMLPPAGPFEIDVRQTPKVVVLVGPTGVGKTTTIAKLAAHFKLREAKQVGLITIDTYRIAAVEQLKAYAQIMSLPLEVVFTPDELVAAITQLSDCDLILVDTSGRSHRDTVRLSDLRTFLEAARTALSPGQTATQPAGSSAETAYKPLEVHLLLSCTSHADQLLEVARRFASLGVDGMVFTKLDEAVGAGVILNVASQLQWQMSYLTTGQDVPDDIEVGHRRRVVEMLLRDESSAAPNDPRMATPDSAVDQLA